MLSMFLDIEWMVQKVKCLISTDSHIECASSDLVLRDVLEVHNRQSAYIIKKTVN